MAKPKVFIFLPVDQSGESHKRIIEAGCELHVEENMRHYIAESNEDYVLRPDTETSALVGVGAGPIPISKEVMERLPDLRLIAMYTVGFDNVDMGAATKMGILVTHCPTEANWGGVAEGTVAYMLAILKRVREKDRHVKQGGWRDMSLKCTYVGRRADGYPGLTIGIIGLGRIGTRLADLLAPWRVRILACDPYVDDWKFIQHGVEQVDLETLLKTSDVVTIHCNLTEETDGLIGVDQLRMMKPNAILMNAARGPIVDVDALVEALKQDRIAGAALDVLPEEPPDPKHPLFGLGDKVLFSPHMITSTHKGDLEPAIPWVTNAVIEAMKGNVPEHVYNVEAIPAWKEKFGGKSLI